MAAYTISTLSQTKLATSDVITGYEIVERLGKVKGLCDARPPQFAFAGFPTQRRSCVDEMIEDARERLALMAAKIGANAVVGIKINVKGKSESQSVLATGTAVKMRKV